MSIKQEKLPEFLPSLSAFQWKDPKTGSFPSVKEVKTSQEDPSGGFDTLLCAPVALAMGAIQELMDMYNQFQRFLSELAIDQAKLLGGSFDTKGNLNKGIVQMMADDQIEAGQHDAKASIAQGWAGFGAALLGGLSMVAMGASWKAMSGATEEAQLGLKDAQTFQEALKTPSTSAPVLQEQLSPPGSGIEMQEMRQSAPERETTTTSTEASREAHALKEKWIKGQVHNFEGELEPNPEARWYKPWVPKQVRVTDQLDTRNEALELLKNQPAAEGEAIQPIDKVHEHLNQQVEKHQNTLSGHSQAHNTRVNYINIAQNTGQTTAQSSGQMASAGESQEKAKAEAEASVDRSVQQTVAEAQNQSQRSADAQHDTANQMIQHISAMAVNSSRA